MVSLRLPVRLVSEANVREHWAARAKRAKAQRGVAKLAVEARIRSPLLTRHLPLRIVITRYGVRLLDTDNLARACKAVRDGIADALGVDDGSPYLHWAYDQETGREYAVGVEIYPVGWE